MTTATTTVTIKDGQTKDVDNNNSAVIETTNSTNSSISIVNKNRNNEAKIFIDGFPNGIRITQNDKVIKDYEPGDTIVMPANQPTNVVQLFGQFKQQDITVTNITVAQETPVTIGYRGK